MSLNYLLVAALLAANPPAPKSEPAPEPGRCAADSDNDDAATSAAAAAARAASEATANSPDAPHPAKSKRDDAIEAYVGMVASRLVKAGSARERGIGLSLALLTANDSREDREARLRKEAEAAPGDALLQFLAAGMADAGCKLPAECMRVKESPARIEPDNGMAWIAAMQFMGEPNTELMERAAATKRFDDHFAEGFDVVFAVVRSEPPPKDLFENGDDGSKAPQMTREGAVFASATAFGAMAVVPAAMNTGFACMEFPGRELPARQLEACARVGRGMMRYGTSLMTQGMGFDMIPKSKRGPDDDAANRSVFWRKQAQERLLMAKSWDEIERYVADLRSTGSDSRATELLMQRLAIPLEPPSDWVPDKDE